MKPHIFSIVLFLLLGCTSPPDGKAPWEEKGGAPYGQPTPTEQAPYDPVKEVTGTSTAGTQDGQYVINIQEERILSQAHVFPYHTGTDGRKITTLSFNDDGIKLVYKDELNYYAEYTLLDNWTRTVVSIEPSNEVLNNMVKDQAGQEFEVRVLLVDSEVTRIKIGPRSFYKNSPKKGGPQTHTVKSGETLRVLAMKFKCSPDELKEINPDLASRGYPLVGEIIKIPQ